MATVLIQVTFPSERPSRSPRASRTICCGAAGALSPRMGAAAAASSAGPKRSANASTRTFPDQRIRMACTGEFRRRTLEEILEILNAHREELAAPYGVRRMEIFGSYARGEAGPESDLDLLVEFEEPPGMFRFLALEHRLSERLGVRVERVTREALQFYIGPNIAEEVLLI